MASEGELTFDGQADLVGHVADLADGVRQIVVLLQEVKGAKGQQLEGDAHVAVVVEPVVHLDTQAGGQRQRETERQRDRETERERERERESKNTINHWTERPSTREAG